MVSDPSQSQQKADNVLNEEIAKSPQLESQDVTKVGFQTSEVEVNAGIAKETLKQSPKKPKKRKPKTPRDETAPRQPLTGNSGLQAILLLRLDLSL